LAAVEGPLVQRPGRRLARAVRLEHWGTHGLVDMVIFSPLASASLFFLSSHSPCYCLSWVLGGNFNRGAVSLYLQLQGVGMACIPAISLLSLGQCSSFRLCHHTEALGVRSALVAPLLKCSYVCFLGVLYIRLYCVNNLNHIIYYRYSFSVPIPVSHALLVIAPLLYYVNGTRSL
jgi:hypothetical protein